MIIRILNILLITLLLTSFQANRKNNTGLKILFDNEERQFTKKHRQLITTIISQSEKKIRSLLATLPKNIKVIVAVTDENIDELGGVNGATKSNTPAEVIIAISSVYPGGVEAAIKKSLAVIVFHEFHHLSRGWAIQDNKFGAGIPIATVNEGLALVFAEQYTGVSFEMFNYPKEVNKWVKEIKELPKNASYDAWMFEHPDGRCAIGYRAGNYVIHQAMRKSGKNILELSKLSPAQVFNLAGY